MRIGLDASLAVGDKAGVGHYTNNLINALARIDNENDYTLFPFFGATFHGDIKSLKAPSSNFSIYMDAESKQTIEQERNRLGIDNATYYADLDMLHSTTFFIPKSYNGNMISTIYDLSFLLFPQCHTEANRLYCLQGTLDAVFHCQKLIAISENTKKDLIEYFDVEEDRVIVTPLAPGEAFKLNNDEPLMKSILKKHNIAKPFIFSLGSIEPRKNLVRLVQAYAQLDEQARKEVDLVIAGGSGWLNSDIYQEIKAKDLQNSIKFLGYVPDQELPVLYSAAKAFAYPSLYEGFGLPVVEAMACGAPVITSDNSSLKEIAQGAALLIDPLDIDNISEAIQNIITDDKLSKKLKEDGFIRASQFTWQKTAQKTLDTYRSLGR